MVPAPLYSPDGQFWWDGQQWVPLAAQSVGPTYAFFGLRFWAYLLDSLLLMLPILPLQALVLGPYFHNLLTTGRQGGVPLYAEIPITLAAAALVGVYMVVMWTRTGQTLGMRAVGIECVAQQTGQPMQVEQAVKRSLVFWLPNLLSTVPVLGMLGLLPTISFLVVAFDSRKQGLHDKFADSVVLMSRRPRGLGKSAVVLLGIGGTFLLATVFWVLMYVVS